MSLDIHALSGAYAVDALDDAERAAFEQHLTGCSACQAEVESLTDAVGDLSALSEWEPPAALRERVLHGITLVRQLPPIVDTTTRRTDNSGSSDRSLSPSPSPSLAPSAPTAPAAPAEPTSPVAPAASTDELAQRRGRHAEQHRSPLRWLVAAATAAVLVVGGFTAWRSTSGADTPPPTVAEQVRTAADAKTKEVSLRGGGSATIVRSVALGKAVIITSELPSAPTGKVYQLWLQDRTGHMTSAGLLAASGNQTVVLQGDATASQGAGITVEPAGGSEQPTSNPIGFTAFA